MIYLTYVQKSYSNMKKTIIGVCMATMIACTPTKQSTIDTTLQFKVDSILQNKMSEINAISGQAIVMDMEGNIKAMVGNGKKQPSALMCAVSINKALEAKKISLSDIVDTGNGVIIFNGDTIFDHNWHRGGYGKITLKNGLVWESNIAIHRALDIVDVKAVDSLVTPLEMLKLFNDVSKNDSLKSAFRYCVTDGLGRPAASEKVEVAGLSGRNVVSEANPERIEYAVEFVGYFPANEPKYSIIVSMNKIGFPASGGLMVGSVFQEIVDYMTE